jgi:hypothetical protein
VNVAPPFGIVDGNPCDHGASVGPKVEAKTDAALKRKGKAEVKSLKGRTECAGK